MGAGMPPPSTRKPGTKPEVMAPEETPAPEQEQVPEEPSDLEKAGGVMKGLLGY
jgi:hypothetical protein